MNFSVTKPYFVDLITQQAELPALLGFPQPEPSHPGVFSAGWGNVRGDPENKTMFDSKKPETHPLVGAYPTQFEPLYDPYRNAPIFGPFVRFNNRF